MTTGDFTDWAGSIAEIGPVYPFVGIELLLVIAGVVFWVAWHIAQLRSEAKRLQDEESKFS